MITTTPQTPYFLIDQPTSAADNEIRITLRNLPRNKVVTVESATTGPYYCINAPLRDTGISWSCHAEYLADSSGDIDMRKAPAIGGDFTGLHPMGLLYCLIPGKQGKPAASPADIPGSGYTLHLRAQCDGVELCSVDIRREYLIKGSRSQRIEDPDYQGMLYLPSSSNPPAVIVLSGSEGGTAKAQNIAQLLCGHGFAALSVGYFGAGCPRSSLRRIPLETVERAARYLAGRGDIDAHRIGLYGRSKGAEMALAAAQRIPSIAAVVANSPSAQILEGLHGRLPARCSSWTWRGTELPYRKFGIRDVCGSRQRRSPEAAGCAIRAEDIKAPLLMFASTHDEIWTAFSSMTELTERRLRNHVELPTVSVPCTSVGHMLTVPWLPNPRYPAADRHTNAAETARAWNTMIDFLNENL